MKKIIYITLIVLSFLLFNKNVHAITFGSERFTDVAVRKVLGSQQSDNTGGRIFVNGTNEIAYCIEPFGTLTNNGTYYSYNGDPSKVNLDKSRIERINKLIYYGYGYKNHTERKWLIVTQMMVWRAAVPNGQFNWLQSLSNKVIINPYNAEIAELETLIRTHDTKPSFYDNNTLLIKNNLTLTDTNFVLSNYKIKSASLVNARIEENNLIIEKTDELGTGEIVLENDGELNKTSEYYYDSESQNVVVRGNYEPVELKLKVAVIKGSVTIKKIDQELEVNESQGDSNINGAIFELFDSDNNFIQEITLDEEGIGKVENLDVGSYIIKEKEPGTGYIKSESVYNVEITIENKDVEVIIANKVIKSLLKVKKLFGSKKDLDNNTMRPESAILFELYDTNDNLLYECITDELGEFEITLPYGTYKLVQKTSSTNYKMVEDQIIVIDSNTAPVIELVLNDVEIEVPNAALYISTLEELQDICILSMNKLLS